MNKNLFILLFSSFVYNSIFSQITKSSFQLSYPRCGTGTIAYGDKIIRAGGTISLPNNAYGTYKSNPSCVVFD